MARKTTGGRGGTSKAANRDGTEAPSGQSAPSEETLPTSGTVSAIDEEVAKRPLDSDVEERNANSPMSEELAMTGPDEGGTALSGAAQEPEPSAEPPAAPDDTRSESSEAPSPEVGAPVGTEALSPDPTIAAQTPDAPPLAEPEPVSPHDTETAAQPSVQEKTAEDPKPVPPSDAPPRKGGFLPLLIGGIVAGGIGYGVHFLMEDTSEAELASLRAEIAALQATLGALPPPADLSILEAEFAELRMQIAEMPPATAGLGEEEINAAVSQLRSELEDAEGLDLGPVQSRLDDVETAIGTQQADWDSRMTALEADMADLRDLAERRVVEAEAAIDSALARAGLEMLRAALETGAPYSAALARLREAEVDVPEALAAPALSGIATLETLQETFPDASRRALRVALQESPSDTTFDRFANFFRAQVGARSTVPREGDDPDAILSRAAAAVETGDLEAALTEIDGLPAEAQAAMDDWLGDARARLAAEAALPALTITIATE